LAKYTVRIIGAALAAIMLASALPQAAATAEPQKEAARTVPVCPAQPATLPLGSRMDLKKILQLPKGMDASYAVPDTQTVRVTTGGIAVPLAQGTGTVTVYPHAAIGNGEPPGSEAPSSCTVKIRVTAAAPPKLAFPPKAETRKVKAANKTFTVQTVVIPKGMPVDVGLGKDRIGGTEPLDAIAKRRNAQIAVNGTFFEAYGGVPEPWGTVIADGEIAHIGNTGTMIGFTASGQAKMESLKVIIRGTVEGENGRTRSWYAYFVNRTPSSASGSAAILYTPKRGGRIGAAKGTAVVVNKGVVERIARNENAAIPANGYVLLFAGAEEKMAERFAVGKRVRYEAEFTGADGRAVDWSDVVTAIGAGPRVVKDGKVAVSAEKEGFTEAKITTASAARSGIGIRADGSIVVVTVGSATIKELGAILVQLGAKQGMNLDGGASSGLYADGKLRTVPGRSLSNALLFGPKLAFRP